MSQKGSRNGPVGEEKEKRQTESPVKEMKKKMAANAEKEKLAAAEKQSEKAVDKKTENTVEKKTPEKTEKHSEKQADKKADRSGDKKDGEKAKEDNKGEKSGKADRDQRKDTKPKQNGKEKAHNGVTDVTLAPNGNDEVLNGTVGGDSDDDDAMLVIDDQDELFPELTYDDTSDVDCFEPPTPENGPSRSFTRRSQVKVTRTPETPRPASDKQPDKDASAADADIDQKMDTYPKQDGEEKSHNGVADGTLTPNGNKVYDDYVMLVIDGQDELFPELTYDHTSVSDCFETPTPENGSSRSFTRQSQVKVTRTPETPRPASDKQPDKDASADDSKEPKTTKPKEDVPAQSDRKLRSADSPKPEGKKPQEKSQESPKKAEKADSKFEKADGKAEKANAKTEKAEEYKQYTESKEKGIENGDSVIEVIVTDDLTQGNNTTMEMDITETSSFMSAEPSLDDSWNLISLRKVRGRKSYKSLKELQLPLVIRSERFTTSTNVSIDQSSIPTDQPARPTGTVVGRKRRPEDAEEAMEADIFLNAHGKRMRLLDRLAHPFRRHEASTPIPRRAAEIVGINTDLPLTAPVATTSSVDPEVLKPTPIPTPEDKDHKRCVLM